MMREFKLLLIAAFAVVLFSAVASAVASAEEDKGSPSILVTNATTFEGSFKLGATVISQLKSAQRLESPSGSATIKGCKELSGSKTDTNLCVGLISFNKWKSTLGTTCRSETEAGTKDPVETVLMAVDIHIASELSQEKVLEPLAIFVVLGQAGEEKDLIMNCGGIKDKVLGAFGCLFLPGLKEIAKEVESWEFLCKTDLTEERPNGDQLTGTCQQLCELLEKTFGSTLGVEVQEMSALLVHATGKFNQTAIIDD